MLLSEKRFTLCLFVRLQNPKERKSILNDVSYLQTTVWDWKFHIKLSNEICELRIVTEFMIFSLSKIELITKLSAKRFLKHIYKKKVNDVSALRYAIIKLRREKV